MDARAEAERSGPLGIKVAAWEYRMSDQPQDTESVFQAAAAYALREFGDLLACEPRKRDEWHEITRRIGHTPEAWRMYAHHIADGIAEVSND